MTLRYWHHRTYEAHQTAGVALLWEPRFFRPAAWSLGSCFFVFWCSGLFCFCCLLLLINTMHSEHIYLAFRTEGTIDGSTKMHLAVALL